MQRTHSPSIAARVALGAVVKFALSSDAETLPHSAAETSAKIARAVRAAGEEGGGGEGGGGKVIT